MYRSIYKDTYKSP